MHRNLCAGRIAAIAVIAPCATAFGVPPDIVLPSDRPDVFSGMIGVSYDATIDLLTANGFTFTYDNGDGNQQAITVPRAWSVEAVIDDLGNAISGSLTIEGTIPAGGFVSGTLLTADLLDFGFQDSGGDPLEFFWNVTGGDLASDFGLAAVAATILSFTNFPGNWQSDWDNLGGAIPTGVADTGIPSPAGATALAMCGIGLAARRRRAC